MKVERAHWNILSSCNLPCGFCYLWRRPAVVALERGTAERLVRELAAHVDTLIFGGGDPLMHEDLFDLVALAKTSGMRVELHTNAVLLESMDGARLLRMIDRLGLSLDGATPNTHDTMRSAPGNFEAVVSALKLANKLDVPTTVRSLVTRRNVDDVKGIACILSPYPCVDKWSVRQFTALGRGAKTQAAYQLDDLAFARVAAEIREHVSRKQSFPKVNFVSTDIMANCFCLIAEDGTFYGHPEHEEEGYEPLGKFPEIAISDIFARLRFDRSVRAKTIDSLTTSIQPMR